jgi:plastocyanin
LTWRWALASIAIAEVVLLGIVGIAYDDRETIVFAALLLVALALLRVRRGLLGTIAITLLLADVAVWTVPGAIGNLAHRDEFLDVFVPGAIGALAVSGVVAGITRLVGWRTERAVTASDADTSAPRTRRAPLVFLVVVLVAVGAFGTAALVRGAGADRGPQPGDIALGTSDMEFSDESLEADAGTIGLHLDNSDLFWHTFTIDELGVDLWAPSRGARRVEFDAEPGRYEFVCAIPAHESAGMKGVLVVR